MFNLIRFVRRVASFTCEGWVFEAFGRSRTSSKVSASATMFRDPVFAPDVHLGLPCSPLAWAYLARPRPEPARFDLGWWDSALRPAADRPVYPLGR
jgi:hypothetical protein